MKKNQWIPLWRKMKDPITKKAFPCLRDLWGKGRKSLGKIFSYNSKTRSTRTERGSSEGEN